MFQSTKPKHLRTDASLDTRYSRALSTQLPRVIAERAIHHGQVMGGFWLEPINFLVDILHHAHWLRIGDTKGVLPQRGFKQIERKIIT